MNQQNYLKQLARQNGQCSCSSLRELYAERRILVGLERECDFLRAHVDLANPQPIEADFLQNYLREARRLKNNARNYHHMLELLARQGKLMLVAHEKVVTVNCTGCRQQIDLIN